MRYKHFSKTDRLEISVLLKRGYSHREIGWALGKHHSSVSREIKHNSVDGVYDPNKAHHKAYIKRRESKYIGMKVRGDPVIEEYIWKKLPLGWSPECIAGRMGRDTGMRVSHPSIYKYLYHNPYGNYLCKFLKYKRYSKKRRKQTKTARELIPNRVWIDVRPEKVNARAEFGHFEGDTMGRPKDASPETLVVVRERKSRRLFAVKVPRLKYTMEGFKDILNPYQDILETITFDNGVENVRHEMLGIPTYFCHPYSSWEKGSVERGIRSIREYIPKKVDLEDYSDDYIVALLDRINNTPMKCLDWLTSNEVFEKELALKVVSSKVASSKSYQVDLANLSLKSYEQCRT